MGFIVKSAFWLGIVLSAMPLGQLLLSDPTSGVGGFVCSPAAAWAERFASKEVSYKLGAAGCVALAAARVVGASSPGDRATSEAKTAPSRGSSTESLTDADRQPPWIGPGLFRRVEAGGRRICRVISVSQTLTPSAILSTIETIREDFAFLDDWEDRYRYVIELGRSLEPLPEGAHNNANKVRGCVSQVWIEREPRANQDGRTILHFRGDSDSHLVRGLVAIAFALYSDRTAAEILETDAMSTFRELGLEQHLTPQRSNGVRSMIERIRSDARASE